MSPGFVADMVTDTYFKTTFSWHCLSVTYVTELASFKKKILLLQRKYNFIRFFLIAGFLVSTDNLDNLTIVSPFSALFFFYNVK